MLEECFERPLPPPVRFLQWLIEHPDRLHWPVEKRTGAKREYSPQTQANRVALMGDDPAARSKAIETAQSALALRGAIGSGHQWWAFEGWTEADVYIETERLVLLIEGKRTDVLSPATDWFPERNQLWRNVEVAASIAGGKDYAMMLIAEHREEAESSLAASLPHLSSDERSELGEHYLGCVTWREVCQATGLDFLALPDTIEDVAAEPSCT